MKMIFLRYTSALPFLLLFAIAGPAQAQAVTYDHGASATATGPGAAGTPSLGFNVAPGQNRIVFITALFERDHCSATPAGAETAIGCTNDPGPNSNFAAPNFEAQDTAGSSNIQIQFTVTGPGGSITVTNPLASPAGDLRFLSLFQPSPASAAGYSQEMYFVALYESQLRVVLGGVTGNITITLPNVDAPNRLADEAILVAQQFNNVNQVTTGGAGGGIVRSLIGNNFTNCNTGLAYTLGLAPGTWSVCATGGAYDAGQAPTNANSGVLLVGFNGFARSGTMDFLPSPGFTELMNPAVTNNDPSTSGTSGAHWLTSTESDGFSASFQFVNGTPAAASIEMQSQNGGFATTTGGMFAGFTMTAATLNLAITKTDGKTVTTQGGTNTYTLVVTNPTVNYADGAIVTDPVASGLTKTAVSCVAAGGAVCPASLSVASLENGALIPTLPPGGSLTFTVTTTVSASATGSVTNTGTVATPTGYTDTSPANNTATDTDTIAPSFGTCDARMWLTQSPGAPTPTTLYQINTSTNPFTFASQGTAAVLYNAVGYNTADNYLYGFITTNTNTLVRIGADGTAVNLGAVAGLPVATYISGAFGIAGDILYVKDNNAAGTVMYAVNVATLTATPVTLSAAINIADWAWVGGLLYAVTNGGQLVSVNPTTGAVTNIGAPNGLPAGFFGAMYGAPNGLYGSGNNPPSGFYKFDLATGAATLISGSPGSNANDGANCATADITFGADLSITKTNTPGVNGNVDQPNDTYTPGTNVVYTIVVSNSGPFGAQNVTVSDPLPTGITTASWTCTGTAGGVCTASGTGAINDATVDLPVGGSVTYLLTLTVPADFTGNLINTGTVTAGAGTSETNLANNTATDDDVATGSITIVKDAQPDNASAGFVFNGTGAGLSNFTLDDNADPTFSNTRTFTGLAPGSYTVSEGAMPGWALTGLSCVDPDSGTVVDIDTRTATIDVDAGETVTCTFTNVMLGQITIVKNALPDDAQDFTFNTTGTGLSAFSLDDDADPTLSNSQGFNDLLPGTYTVTEAAAAGWTLTGLSCTDLDNGTTTDLSTATATIDLDAGESIQCTYTNSKQAILRLNKELPQGRFVGTDQFALSIAGPGAPTSVTTTGSTNTPSEVVVVDPATLGSPYTLSEAGALGADLANYTTTYTCTNTSVGGSGGGGAGNNFAATPGGSGEGAVQGLAAANAQAPSGSGTSFQITPVAGDDVTCTFINTRAPLAELSITKTNTPVAGPNDQSGDTVTRGTTTDYTIVVTNNGPDAITGAVVRDPAQTGLTCNDPVSCTGSGCPSATVPLSSLQSAGGVVLGTVANGGTVTFTLSCTVQ